MTPLVESLGLVAGVLTTLAFLPQVVKIWRSGSAGDLSLAMLVSFSIGVALWLAYGVLIRSVAVIAANAVTLVLALILLRFKLGTR
jgi:MtN3 and saliva related transmembrane protein